MEGARESPCRMRWRNMTPEQRFRRKARRGCCCLTFLLVLNTLLLLWVSSRTSFLEWFFSSPDNQMMLEVEQDTFCSDICADLKCGAMPCNSQCVSQCNSVLQAKLDMFGYAGNEDGDEEALQTEQGDSGERHHRRHSGSRSGSRSGSHSHSHDGGRHGGKHHHRHHMHHL